MWTIMEVFCRAGAGRHGRVHHSGRLLVQAARAGAVP